VDLKVASPTWKMEKDLIWQVLSFQNKRWVCCVNRKNDYNQGLHALVLILIEVQEHLQRLIIEKTKANFNIIHKIKTPNLYRQKKQVNFNGGEIGETKASLQSQKMKEEAPGEVSREEFLKNLYEMEMQGNDETVYEEVSKKWKEMSTKIRYDCRFDYKFNPDKYRVGTHSFRYTVGENEMTWNTALKFLFNNVKKLILLQEKLQSLSIFGTL
jgi:hypothetical protein